MSLRAHIVFPDDLAAQIDEIAGERGRNAYVVENVRAAVRRDRMLKFLEDIEKNGPIWKDEDHPDIARLGSAEWVRQMRSTRSERKKRLERKFAQTR